MSRPRPSPVEKTRPPGPPATRAGSHGFFKVVTPDEARTCLRRFAPVGVEDVPVEGAVGRVVATDIHSAVNLPHFHRANMDGYAVRARDTFGTSASVPVYLKVVGTIEMGKEAKRRLQPGEAMGVATGGMLPPGADGVVMVEHTEEIGNGMVEIRRGVSPWENVIRIGEDIKKDDLVFPAGKRIRPYDIGALTGVGMTRLPVFRRPSAALISTGDEIVVPQKTPRPGQIRNVNQYSLRAMIAEAEGTPLDFGVVKDRPERLKAALGEALRTADLIIISGGSSVGTKDMTLDVIASFSPSEVIFYGISVAPGKPTIFARALGKPVLGLPGHPVSALVIFLLFGAPLLRLLGGENPSSAFEPRRSVRAFLGKNIASQPGREDYVRVTLERKERRLMAHPLPGKSGAIFSLVKADGMVRVPLQDEGIEHGEEVEVILF